MMYAFRPNVVLPKMNSTVLKTLTFCGGLLAVGAALADSPKVYPLAPSPQVKSLPQRNVSSTKPDAPLRLTPPTVSVTRAVRSADGHVTLQCVQQPNPKIAPHPVRTRVNPQPDGAH